LQEAVEACYAEHAAQKAKREVEAKAKKEAKKQRIVEKKKKLEYIQQLWDEVIAEDTALLEGSEGFQVAGFKHKKVVSGDKEEHQPLRKLKRGNKRSTAETLQLRWGVLTPVRGV